MARLLPFLAFVAVALLFLAGMHYYVWARLVRDPQLPAGTARLVSSLIATMALVLPATLVLSRTRGAPRPMVWIAFLWMGVVFLLSAFLGLADAGRALAWVARYRNHPALRMWGLGNEVLHKIVHPAWVGPQDPARERNAEAFTADGFYRTGDLVRRGAGGNLIVEGRVKDLINRGGEKISAEEIEGHLLAHPAIETVAVVAMPDAGLGERI